MIALGLGAASCSQDRSSVGPRALGIAFEEVLVPTGTRSGQPRLTSAGDSLVLSWVDRSEDGAALRFAVYDGARWSEAITAASGDDWFVNWADTPGVTPIGDASYAAFYLQRTGPQAYAYAIRVVLSTDGGVSWSAPVTPHAGDVQAEFGFVSALAEAGGVRLVWLDGEATQSGHHDEHSDMALRTAVLQTDGTLSYSRMIDERVCECCPTSAVHTPAGLVTAYRGRSDAEVRDIRVAVLGGSGDPHSGVPHPDGWQIAGCPVNGPSLSSSGDRVVLAWFTGADGGEVRALFSADGGQTWDGEARTVDAARPEGRVGTAMLPDGDALVSWIARDGETGRLRLARLGEIVHDPVEATEIDLGRSSGIPRIAISGRDVWVAWVDTQDLGRVRTARAPLDAFD